MATKFCLNCGGEFVAAVDECPDCEIPLVDSQPLDHLDAVVGDDGQLEGEVRYELHTWAVESRVMIQQLLSAAGILHAWEGTDLVVSAAAEKRVDGMVNQVVATTLPTLDPDAPKVAYDIDDWSDEQQTLLMHALDDVAISYEFDQEGALVVLEENEERVEAILDRIEYPDGVPGRDPDSTDDTDDTDSLDAADAPDLADANDDNGGDSVGDDDEDDSDDSENEADGAYDDGLEAMDVLSDLFVAADRLRHRATDAEGVLSMVDRASDAERLRLPYGFDRGVWRDIVTQVTSLRDLLEDDESKDDAIEEHAEILRATLRNYV